MFFLLFFCKHRNIVNLLQCDVMMIIITAVIDIVLNDDSINIQESHLQKVTNRHINST